MVLAVDLPNIASACFYQVHGCYCGMIKNWKYCSWKENFKLNTGNVALIAFPSLIQLWPT